MLAKRFSIFLNDTVSTFSKFSEKCFVSTLNKNRFRRLWDNSVLTRHWDFHLHLHFAACALTDFSMLCSTDQT